MSQILIYNRLVVKLFQRGDRLYTSESDVFIRQILTYHGGPRAVRVKIFVMAVDP